MPVSRSFIAIFLLSAILPAVPEPLFGAVSVDEEEVVFTLNMPGATKVFVTGDFNGWNDTLDKMTRVGDEFEIRLYLIPGKYRYMFVVDGESTADPDNPWRDEEGRTFFVFRQKNEGYEIVYSGGIDRQTAAETVEAAIDFRGYAEAGEERSDLFIEPRLSVMMDGKISAEISTGFEYHDACGGKIDSRLVRADASFAAERGRIRAFNRSGDLDLGDPLAIFGSSGPFGYGAGIFSRGVEIEGDILFGVKGRAFFSDRLEGYRSALESCEDSGPPCDHTDNPSRDVDPADRDSGGLMASFSSRIVSLEYYYRRDSGPGGTEWSRPGDPGWIYTGYLLKDIHGGTIRAGGPMGTTLEIEYLDGRTRLSSTARDSAGAGEVPFEYSLDWESGRRVHVGISGGHRNVDASLSWNRTTLEGDPVMRMGRTGDAGTAAEINLGYKTGFLQARFKAGADWFHNNGSAVIFWFQRYNFWLDGDDIEAGRLPFLYSRGLKLLSFTLEERDERVYGPYPMAGKFSISLRSDMYEKDRRVLQIGLTRGFELGGNLSLHFDIRHVSYDMGGRADISSFMDVWAGCCARISDSAWISAGAGVSPYSFDGWLCRITGYGREKYLLDRIIPIIDATGKTDRVSDAIEPYEKELSEEWTVSFEAGILF